MRAFLVVLIALVALLCLPRLLQERKAQQQQDWLDIQKASLERLASEVKKFDQAEGRYPENLEELVSTSYLSRAKFNQLKFKVNKESNGQPWLYRKPATESSYFMIAPELIHIWPADVGRRLVCRFPDMVVFPVLGSKERLLIDWGMEEKSD